LDNADKVRRVTEAHTFPYFFEVLVEDIRMVSEMAYVVLTTHNPLLMSKL